MRFLLFFIFILMLPLLSQASETTAPSDGTLSEYMFKGFLHIYKHDPSALQRFGAALRKVSPEQMNETMSYLDVTHFTYLHPMIIHAYELPSIKGMKNAHLSLMAPRGHKGEMIPIPFQIDEFDETGLIWIKGQNSSPSDGKPGVWDGADQLVFMYRDGADHRYNPEKNGSIKGTILKEIKLDSPRDPPRWLYLVEDNPERSDAQYVTTDLDKGLVDSNLYAIKYAPSNLIKVSAIIPKAGPHAGQNMFGGVHIKLSTGILSKILRFHMDKNNIHASPIAVKQGPIRNIMLVKARIWYFGLPTLFSQKFMVDFYEQGILVPTRMAIDSMRAVRFFVKFLRDPTFSFTVRFNNLKGARTTFQSVYDQGQFGYADGKMTDFEMRMTKTRLPGNWFFMDSNQGWQMFFSNHIPVTPDGILIHFLDDVDMHMVYDDNIIPATNGKKGGISLRVGFAGKGLPQKGIDILADLPKLDYKHMNTLGQLIIALAKAGDKGKLDKIDTIINKRMHELVKTGVVNNVSQLADMFLNDIKRMQFIGIPRKKFFKLVRDAMVDAIKKPDAIDNSAVLDKMIELAKKRHINLLNLHYAVMNNSVWTPDRVGKGGPADFNWQLTHAPTFTISNYELPDKSDTPEGSDRQTMQPDDTKEKDTKKQPANTTQPDNVTQENQTTQTDAAP